MLEAVAAVFPSWAAFAACCAIVVLAQVVYVTFGFGSGLILVGLMALVLPDLQDVVVLLLLINLPAELSVVVQGRRHVQWKGVGGIAAGMLLGIPLGTWVLKAYQPESLLIALGVVLVVSGTTLFLTPGARRVRWPRWSPPAVGALSGSLTGMFGTGGPPLILYYQLAKTDKAAFRSNLMTIFLLATFVRGPAYLVSGLITLPRVAAGVALLPAVLVATLLGHAIHVRLAESTFQRAVSVAIAMLGIVLLARVVS